MSVRRTDNSDEAEAFAREAGPVLTLTGIEVGKLRHALAEAKTYVWHRKRRATSRVEEIRTQAVLDAIAAAEPLLEPGLPRPDT